MPMRRRSPGEMRLLYDWFHRYYGLIEKNIGPTLVKVLDRIDPAGDRFADDSFLELACGSASLGLLVAPRVRVYEGRDQSEKMLDRARARWQAKLDPSVRDAYSVPPFSVIDLTDPEHMTGSALGAPEWIGISFALHLFDPETEAALLQHLFSASGKGVIIFDHEQRWTPASAFIEWLEGSWYDQYVKIDFATVARSMGARFSSAVIGGCQVMEFLK